MENEIMFDLNLFSNEKMLLDIDLFDETKYSMDNLEKEIYKVEQGKTF